MKTVNGFVGDMCFSYNIYIGPTYNIVIWAGSQALARDNCERGWSGKRGSAEVKRSIKGTPLDQNELKNFNISANLTLHVSNKNITVCFIRDLRAQVAKLEISP